MSRVIVGWKKVQHVDYPTPWDFAICFLVCLFKTVHERFRIKSMEREGLPGTKLKLNGLRKLLSSLFLPLVGVFELCARVGDSGLRLTS